MVSETARDRAQLILVGALLLATVILGLSMLLNSVLFTGATGATGASVAIEETDFVDYDVELGMRELVVRLNHATRNQSAAELGDAISVQTRNFSHALGESRSRSSSVAVSVDYSNASSTFGGRIVQDHNADMSDPGGGVSSWQPVDAGTNARIGWFSLSVDLANTSDTAPFEVTAQNDTHDLHLLMERNDTNSLQVETRLEDATGAVVASDDIPCGADRGRVLLDLYAGTAFTGRCSFTGIATLDRPTSLRFGNVDELRGKYAIVTNETSPSITSTGSYPTCDGVPPSLAEPCIAPAVWEANVSVDVLGPSIRYENAYNMTVYTNER